MARRADAAAASCPSTRVFLLGVSVLWLCRVAAAVPALEFGHVSALAVATPAFLSTERMTTTKPAPSHVLSLPVHRRGADPDFSANILACVDAVSPVEAETLHVEVRVVIGSCTDSCDSRPVVDTASILPGRCAVLPLPAASATLTVHPVGGPAELSVRLSVSVCGDGVVSGLETCDTAHTSARTSCCHASACLDPAVLGLPACLPGVDQWCGDGVVQALRGEQCEPGNDPACGRTCLGTGLHAAALDASPRASPTMLRGNAPSSPVHACFFTGVVVTVTLVAVAAKMMAHASAAQKRQRDEAATSAAAKRPHIESTGTASFSASRGLLQIQQSQAMQPPPSSSGPPPHILAMLSASQRSSAAVSASLGAASVSATATATAAGTAGASSSPSTSSTAAAATRVPVPGMAAPALVSGTGDLAPDWDNDAADIPSWLELMELSAKQPQPEDVNVPPPPDPVMAMLAPSTIPQPDQLDLSKHCPDPSLSLIVQLMDSWLATPPAVQPPDQLLRARVATSFAILTGRRDVPLVAPPPSSLDEIPAYLAQQKQHDPEFASHVHTGDATLYPRMAGGNDSGNGTGSGAGSDDSATDSLGPETDAAGNVRVKSWRIADPLPPRKVINVKNDGVLALQRGQSVRAMADDPNNQDVIWIDRDYHHGIIGFRCPASLPDRKSRLMLDAASAKRITYKWMHRLGTDVQTPNGWFTLYQLRPLPDNVVPPD